MREKKRMALLLAAVMLLSLLVGCGGKKQAGGGGEGVQPISWWITKGDDPAYYLSYEENPVVKFLESKEYGGYKVDLRFVVPVVGAELENFNTLLMTDEYCDIMDMAFSNTYPAELYEEGYIWDLTDYLDEYMPNYQAVLERHPELDSEVYTFINGEKRLLTLSNITEDPSVNFKGFLYRRDWVVKYGVNPQTGAAFTSGYTDPADKNTYYDDVVFPSGGPNPVYISDWEWMFEIFTRALAELGITDGYCYAPYFKVYGEDGSLNAAFGGGTGMWYKNLDGNAAFGGSDESMRAYLQCLNSWYEKGWLDKSFAEHSSDAAYAIDSAKVHMGKVGLWVGRMAETGYEMQSGEDYTEGLMAFGAQIPINDIYGSDQTQNKQPYSLYQKSLVRGSCVLTKKITEEELPAVLTFLDFLYSREGGAVTALGMNKEEFEQTQDELYIRCGLVNGARWEEQKADGTWVYGRTDEVLADCNNLMNPVAGSRLYVGYCAQGVNLGKINPETVITNQAVALWDHYKNTGYISKSTNALLSADESSVYSKVFANVDTYMATTLPGFVKGDVDIDSDRDWDNYCKMLNKYGPEKVTKIFQGVFDVLK